ncbi:MAG: site-2 protease family protein [Myxococcota bacterium]
MDVVYFIVLVGVLIFVHELGHFAWAKFFDVKVLRFSLGFGPKVFGLRRGETEYVVGALPIGGYVKMLGESPHDVITQADEARAFQTQTLWKRFVIVLAGPAMNLLFPLGLFFLVYLGDDVMTPPTVGTVYPNRPADGRLMPGDRIESVDGEPVHTFDEVSRIVDAHAGVEIELGVRRDGRTVHVPITPVMSRTVRELGRVEAGGRIGIQPLEPLAVVGVPGQGGTDDERSPAVAAGLRTFDVVVAADGQPVDRWSDLERALEGNDGTSVPVTYLRPRTVTGALGGLADFAVYDPRVAQLTPEPGSAAPLLRAGLESADPYVSQVVQGSPEHRTGVRPGDRLIALDGRPIRRWATFEADLRAAGNREVELTWRRGNELMSGRFQLRLQRWTDELGQRIERYEPGIAHWLPMRSAEPVPNPSPVRHALDRTVESTVEMVELTALSVVRLFEGRLTTKSIGGPITIFAEAGSAAREGTVDYLMLMAFISINLGLINLLPVPLLDGGHLMFFVVEGVMRRPVSLRTRQYASLVGLAVLLLLMALAFKNDLERHWTELGASRVESPEGRR